MDFHARQYDPQIGRFLGIDPLADAYGQQIFSTYSAMGNAPTHMIDPNGESFYDSNPYINTLIAAGKYSSSLPTDGEILSEMLMDQRRAEGYNYGGGGGGGGGFGYLGSYRSTLDFVNGFGAYTNQINAIFNFINAAQTVNNAYSINAKSIVARLSKPIKYYYFGDQSKDGGDADPQSGGDKNPSAVHSGFPGDGRIHVTNEYKGDVYFKPEGDLNLNDFDFKNDGAYKMGTQSWIPLDGINVNGKVYKISDGYSNIHITENGEVKVLYLGLPGQLHYWFLGGEKSSPPDPSWNNLFNVNKR